MTNVEFMLRGMIYREGDVFIAACIDLTLASQASSPEEAFRKLNCQIEDYIKEAASEPKYALDLIKNRKAPLSWFLKYYYIKFRSFFSSKNNKTIDMPSTSYCH